MLTLEEPLVKSRERVKAYGEVFTPRHMVDRMLDLVAEELETGEGFVDRTFLEPAAGDGNFLVAILAQAARHRAADRTRTLAPGITVRPRLDLRDRAAGGQSRRRQGRHAHRVPRIPPRSWHAVQHAHQPAPIRGL